MKRIGITGQNGFIGSHLFNYIGLFPERYERVHFDKAFFDDEQRLQNFVSSCDVIIHLAAVNRHEDQQYIHDTNINLVQKLISAAESSKSKPHIIFSSSSQEDLENLYGQSKTKGRLLIEEWSDTNDCVSTALIIPNVFGPFGKPFYNSFVATFCHLLINGGSPKIDIDSSVPLVYVGNLVKQILSIADQAKPGKIVVGPDKTIKVSEVLEMLLDFKQKYFDKGEVPELNSMFEVNLFNTFRSFIDMKQYFPRKFVQHTDPRGAFVEIIRLGVGGQVSFSTTVPGITRGNHFHTRKIERFAVIKGSARIQLRRVGTDEVLDFVLDGSEPSYVDMPVWYTHNITNVGEDELYTNFWINEFYDPNDADTYMEVV